MKISKQKIGLTLFVLYVIQYFTAFEFTYLENLQSDSTYRHWSGLALFLLILHQWFLAIYRGIFEKEKNVVEQQKTVHLWIGAFSPLVFFLHSTKPNYGLLLILSVLFFLNLLWGFLNVRSSTGKRFEYFRLGVAVHIMLSVSVMVLTLVHIWLVFYYN